MFDDIKYKYKYIGTEEQLIEHGYAISRGLDYAFKGVQCEEIFINISGLEPEKEYGFKNEILNMDIRVETLDVKLIQDLIDDGLVEVVE